MLSSSTCSIVSYVFPCLYKGFSSYFFDPKRIIVHMGDNWKIGQVPTMSIFIVIFGNIFWRCGNVLTLQGYVFYLYMIFRKKLCFPKSFLKTSPRNYNYTKKSFQKITSISFLQNKSISIGRALICSMLISKVNNMSNFLFLGNHDIC